MQAHPLARKVALAYIVQAVQKADLASASPFVAAAAEAMPDTVLMGEGARRAGGCRCCFLLFPRCCVLSLVALAPLPRLLFA